MLFNRLMSHDWLWEKRNSWRYAQRCGIMILHGYLWNGIKEFPVFRLLEVKWSWKHFSGSAFFLEWYYGSATSILDTFECTGSMFPQYRQEIELWIISSLTIVLFKGLLRIQSVRHFTARKTAVPVFLFSRVNVASETSRRLFADTRGYGLFHY